MRSTTFWHLTHLTFSAVAGPLNLAPQCVQQKTLVSLLMERLNAVMHLNTGSTRVGVLWNSIIKSNIEFLKGVEL